VTSPDVEGLLRELAPQALGAVARRYGEFPDAEDALQEALVTAAVQWPAGLPDRPLSWLITVAPRRLVDEYRRHGCPPTARGARRLALDPPGRDGALVGRLARDALPLLR
jgi:predicted RNA polymerase sigma factor